MSQKFAKKQSEHPVTYNRTSNGSIVVNSAEGRNTLQHFIENKVIFPQGINTPIVEATRPVSIPAGSGVYLA